MAFEPVDLPRDFVGIPEVIGIEKCQEFSASLFYCPVSRCRHTPLWLRQDADP
jgi:hypothetical protein